MNNYQSIFKRYEKKYLLNNNQYMLLKQDFDKYMTEDKYGVYTICNLYFDTDDYELIRRSIEKPIYKEKLRVRSYGVPNDDDHVFLELKKKYRKEVFKRRISIPYKDYMQYMTHGTQPNGSQQILSEIEYFIDRYNPYPRIYIAYDRLALFGNEDKNVRVTFDHNIRFRANHLSLDHGSDGTQLLKEDQRIMEVKVEGAMPLWFVDILVKHNILPTSYSKYGKCYTNHILKKQCVEKERKIV